MDQFARIFPRGPFPHGLFSRKHISPKTRFETGIPVLCFPEIPFSRIAFPESLFPESHIPKSRFPESHFPESRFHESHFPESHFPKSGFPESHFPESGFAESHEFLVQFLDWVRFPVAAAIFMQL
jgi:replication factor A1